MKDKLLIMGVVGVFLLVIYAVRVAPYGNDWKCIVAECRIVK